MKNKGDWMLLFVAFIGGGGFISVKYLMDWGYDPYQVIFGRILVASLCMGIVYHKRLRKITKKVSKKATRVVIVVIVVVAVWLIISWRFSIFYKYCCVNFV